MLDSTGGALVYERTGPDGPSGAAMAETTRLAADWEDAFLAGCRETFPGTMRLSSVLRYAEVSLICIMDPQSKPVSLSTMSPLNWVPERVSLGERVQSLAVRDNA